MGIGRVILVVFDLVLTLYFAYSLWTDPYLSFFGQPARLWAFAVVVAGVFLAMWVTYYRDPERG